MGLKKSIFTKFGIHANEAYHRIKSIRGDNGGIIRYEVDTFFNQEVRASGAQPLESRIYEVPGELNSKMSVMNELYGILRTSHDFINAVDVLEQQQDLLDVAGIELSNSLCFQCHLTDPPVNMEHPTELTQTDIAGCFIHDKMLLIGILRNVSLSNIVWSYDTIDHATIGQATIESAALKQRLAI